MVILEKNEEGNYVISLEIFNEIVAEVVEGDLDYAYLKELYQERAREVGGNAGRRIGGIASREGWYYERD